MKTLDGSDRPGSENLTGGQRLHAEYGGPFLYQPGYDLMSKTPELVIEDIEWHLATVEMKSILCGHIEHV